MSFIDRLRRAQALLQEQGRLSARALSRELDLAGDAFDSIVDELVEMQGVVRWDGKVLVWTGPDGSPKPAPEAGPVPDRPTPRDYTPPHLAEKILQSRSALEGERKLVTVLFADVKGSMDLAAELDPEEWRSRRSASSS